MNNEQHVAIFEGYDGDTGAPLFKLLGNLQPGTAVYARPVEAAGAVQADPAFWKSQRKIIERAIIGLRDGWATRKDAADALAVIATRSAKPDNEEGGPSSGGINESVDFQAALVDLLVCVKNGGHISVQSEKIQALTDIIDARRATAGNAALEGRTVSVDVSTGEADAGNRIFARLTGETGSDSTTLLAEEVERNFASNAAPVEHSPICENTGCTGCMDPTELVRQVASTEPSAPNKFTTNEGE